MKIKELLDSPEKWTRGCFARNSEGLGVGSQNKSATCWCLVGAFNRCYHDAEQTTSTKHSKEVWTKIKEHLKLNTIYYDVLVWNDAPERTFEDIRKLVEELDI